jgi:hypothetical protein
MANFTTPVPDGTDFATETIAGVEYTKNVLADFAGADVLGLVTASPAANSLLGRLKAIADAITTMDGHVDGLEGLATTLNSLVDGLETLIGTTNTNGSTTNTTLTTIAGYLDTVETLIGATNTALAAATPAGTNLIGKVGLDQTTDGTTNKVNIDASLKSDTPIRSSVNSGTTSVTILASNSNRKGAVILNSDANALMLDVSGGTAASTRYQVKLTTDQTYAVEAGYTGLITGIWAADGTGVADVVEYT